VEFFYCIFFAFYSVFKATCSAARQTRTALLQQPAQRPCQPQSSLPLSAWAQSAGHLSAMGSKEARKQAPLLGGKHRPASHRHVSRCASSVIKYGDAWFYSCAQQEEKGDEQIFCILEHQLFLHAKDFRLLQPAAAAIQRLRHDHSPVLFLALFHSICRLTVLGFNIRIFPTLDWLSFLLRSNPAFCRLHHFYDAAQGDDIGASDLMTWFLTPGLLWTDVAARKRGIFRHRPNFTHWFAITCTIVNQLMLQPKPLYPTTTIIRQKHF